MTDVLVVAEHRQGQLRDVTLEAIGAGVGLGRVTVAVIAGDPARYVDQVNAEGVAEIVTVATGSDDFDADVYRAVVTQLVEERRPRIVLAGFTVDAMSYAAGVAALAGLAFVSDAFAVGDTDAGPTATRSFYTGKVEADLVGTVDGAFVLVRPGAFEPVSGAGSAAVVTAPVGSVVSRLRHESYIEPDTTGDVDIAQEKLLLAIGRGVGEQENIKLFEDLAAKMGATLVSSRPLVDAGWMPSSRQIGQSGKTVKPAVYLAFGISGAIQHLAGMKSSETIVAVNTDPDASIFTVAQFGAVADIFDVAEELEKHY
jgi:electron transfer flavoprotein alpha subunit